MNIDGKLLSEVEFDLHSMGMLQIINILCKNADVLNINRDTYIKETLSQLTIMSDVSTFIEFDVD